MQGLVDFCEPGWRSLRHSGSDVLLSGGAHLFSVRRLGVLDAVASAKPFFGRPWIPFLSLVLSGAFASFDKICNMALATAGSSVTASISSLLSYSPPTVPDGSTLMGSAPSATLVNIVTLFQAFFRVLARWSCSSRF